MNLDEFKKCASLVTFKEVDSFDEAKNPVDFEKEINTRIKVWYYRSNDESWEIRTKFVVTDFCTVVLTLSCDSRDFDNYRPSVNCPRNWRRSTYNISFSNSFVVKTLDEAITKLNKQIEDYIYNNYDWDSSDFELVYQLC